MDLYIGFDVSVASSAMCGLSEKGKLVKEATCPTEPEELVKALHALPGRVVAVGLEAGPLSQWLYQHLTEAGFPTVLMETRQVKGALKAMPIKTDRRDAEGIARLLQMGWFRPVHCKSLSAQEMRALLSSRKAIQQATLSLELSIRGVLRNFGLKMGQVAKGRFEQRVLELVEGNPMLEAAANPILSSTLYIFRRYAAKHSACAIRVMRSGGILSRSRCCGECEEMSPTHREKRTAPIASEKVRWVFRYHAAA